MRLLILLPFLLLRADGAAVPLLCEALGVADCAEVESRVKSWPGLDRMRGFDQKYQDCGRLPAKQRAVRAAVVRTELLLQLRQWAGVDSVARSLVALHDRAQGALARGNPPLTKASAEAWADLRMLADTGSLRGSPPQRYQAMAELIQSYPNASAGAQQWICRMGPLALRLRAEWQDMTAAAREEWRARMAQAIGEARAALQGRGIRLTVLEQEYARLQRLTQHFEEEDPAVFAAQ